MDNFLNSLLYTNTKTTPKSDERPPFPQILSRNHFSLLFPTPTYSIHRTVDPPGTMIRTQSTSWRGSTADV